jgi:hypothetical protein
MHVFARLALFLFVALMAPLAATAAERSFSHEGVAADAKRYEAFLKNSWKSDGKSAAMLKEEADKVFSTDPRAASRLLASAVVADDKNSALWSRLAEALLAVKPDPDKGSERYDLPVNASGAVTSASVPATFAV